MWYKHTRTSLHTYSHTDTTWIAPHSFSSPSLDVILTYSQSFHNVYMRKAFMLICAHHHIEATDSTKTKPSKRYAWIPTAKTLNIKIDPIKTLIPNPLLPRCRSHTNHQFWGHTFLVYSKGVRYNHHYHRVFGKSIFKLLNYSPVSTPIQWSHMPQYFEAYQISSE